MSYSGKHRLGLPGLYHWAEMMTRAGQHKPRRWFGLRVRPSRHGGTVIPLSTARPAYPLASRAA